MALKITNNSAQARFLANLNKTNNSIASNLRKLSSGSRISKASDDAASLAIATKIESTLSITSQALNNISDGISVMNVAESGLSQIGNLLLRGEELAVQSANGTLDDTARGAIDDEFRSILSEISRIAKTTEFNGNKLLEGRLDPESGNPMAVQAGTSNTENDRISLNVVKDSTATGLQLEGTSVATAEGARGALDDIESAMTQITTTRAGIGATSNQLMASASNLEISSENLNSAVSTLKGTDFAKEVSDLRQNQVIQKAGLQSLRESNAIGGELLGRLLNTRG